MPLSPEDPVVAIDARVAKRRTGRSKGPEAHQVLADALGIETVGQLLHHYPRRYIDRSRVLPIAKLPIDAYATVIATVRSVAKRQTRRRQAMVTVTIGDGSGFLDLTFFNQPWVASWYREGAELAVSGVVQLYRGTAPARQPGGRGAPQRRAGPRAHRPDHARCIRRPRASRLGRSASWSSLALQQLPPPGRSAAR